MARVSFWASLHDRPDMSLPKPSDLNEILRPAAQQDAFTEELQGHDYRFMAAKVLPDGTYVGIQGLLTTYAICIGITPMTAFQRRYCYLHLSDCIEAYSNLKQGEDVPIGWVARRPETLEDIEAKRRPPRNQ